MPPFDFYFRFVYDVKFNLLWKSKKGIEMQKIKTNLKLLIFFI